MKIQIEFILITMQQLRCIQKFCNTCHNFYRSGEIPRQYIQARAVLNFILRETRRLFAEIFNCSSLEVIFNSGASEGNNTVLKSVWEVLGSSKNEFIISDVEHPSVKKTAEYLKTLGAAIHYIPVKRSGELDLDFIRTHLNEKTALVSCMYANNETGSIFPIQEITKLVTEYNLQHKSSAELKTDCKSLASKLLILKNLMWTTPIFPRISFMPLKVVEFYTLKNLVLM